MDGTMAEKKFLSWVGFKGELSARVEEPASNSIANTSQSGSQSNVARIRELENQLAELRSRRDITSLTKEEFEVLASETAMTLIKTAQSRESKALSVSQKLIAESSQSARELIESAESKTKALLTQAESRGRKYIEAAESEAQARIAEADREAEALTNSKKREAAAVTSAAKREAELLVSSAVTDIADYRSWLSSAISEAERLHRIQTQSLNAAEQAIEQTRNRLAAAFEKLSALQVDIDENLSTDNRPKNKNFVRAGAEAPEADSTVEKAVKRTTAKKTAKKKTPTKKIAKKSPAKKSAARRK